RRVGHVPAVGAGRDVRRLRDGADLAPGRVVQVDGQRAGELVEAGRVGVAGVVAVPEDHVADGGGPVGVVGRVIEADVAPGRDGRQVRVAVGAQVDPVAVDAPAARLPVERAARVARVHAGRGESRVAGVGQ